MKMDLSEIANITSSIDYNIPLFTFMGLLAVNTYHHLTNDDTDYVLEDDPECGKTTGGEPECFWDCQPELNFFDIVTFTTDTERAVMANPWCLEDCFEESQCLSGLFRKELSSKTTVDRSMVWQINMD